MTNLPCPDCDSSNVHVHWMNHSFPYGQNQVFLKAYIPVHICQDCCAEFLAEDAAEIMQKTVNQYLNAKHSDTKGTNQ